jgi:D-alanyl-D-alanine carboxypeptidase (penicillin-binding protein 5/6)
MPLAIAKRLITLTLGLLLMGAALAEQPSVPVPDPPQIGAESYILRDHHSGRVIAARNPDERRDPASLTKLMTAYVIFSELDSGNLSMDEKVRISEKAWRAKGSRMFIEVGAKLRVEDLLKGMIVQSGNDASIALAEHIAGDESAFASVMNQYADQLGMENTQYRNATGLPAEGHYSTPRDTATLAQALISDFPDYYRFYSQRSFTWAGIEQSNRNKLLWRDPDVDGLKTGYTEAAGYCLASSAVKDGMRLISVVMGADSEQARLDQSQSLLSYGFRFFGTHRLYKADEPLTRSKVWKGAAEDAPFGLERDVYVTVPKREYENLNASLSVDRLITAPVEAGKEYGRVTVELKGETLVDRPLVALEGMAAGGLWTRMVDSVWLWFE